MFLRTAISIIDLSDTINKDYRYWSCQKRGIGTGFVFRVALSIEATGDPKLWLTQITNQDPIDHIYSPI